MGEQVPYAYGHRITFFRELTDGETWRPHPNGNGIIVAHPERPPMWCRAENDTVIHGHLRPSHNTSSQERSEHA